MKKEESEKVIEQLSYEWAKLQGLTMSADEQPSFADFYSWLQQNYSAVLRFKTTTSVRDDVERWFDRMFKQNWRN
jgi:hypothetical protein